jgi:hypothetical protein
MASFKNQAGTASALKLILPITGGSCSEPANKKQKKEAQRRVQHVGVQGPFIKSRWSHIPITFSQEDLQLKDYPHNDAMVISCVIKGFLVHNVLVDTGSAADIIVGAKAKTSPSARGLRRGRRSNGDKTMSEGILRSIRHRANTYNEVIPPCSLVQHGGPRVIRPIVAGPAWSLRVTGLICKGASVITVCNPALWEYSGDNLGV